ncbi:glycosylhydrolase family 18-9 [Colletotrichum chrysophilum]|uniref:Glycosylhydrolase family 18-9 n=1 Tax=Colletotrichum chrysophilum TaxID=1836956 RepID=A0AAD9AEU7_9PEZI|nr:glycosylhydrolase family 18-9 [Colletotrichum chrysophilum]
MHNDEWLRTINGRIHVGIRSVQVFHGYRRCSRDKAVWHPGAEDELLISTVIESDDDFYRRFKQWGERIFNNDCMRLRTLQLLFSVSTDLNLSVSYTCGRDLLLFP